MIDSFHYLNEVLNKSICFINFSSSIAFKRDPHFVYSCIVHVRIFYLLTYHEMTCYKTVVYENTVALNVKNYFVYIYHVHFALSHTFCIDNLVFFSFLHTKHNVSYSILFLTVLYVQHRIQIEPMNLLIRSMRSMRSMRSSFKSK